MTVFAIVTAGNVVYRLAGCIETVVAANTVTRYVGVIKGRWQPAHRRMTVVTLVAARDMHCVFSGGYNAVVTRAASTNYLGVSNCNGRHPDTRSMAVFTDVTGVDMRKAFAGGARTIVATGAASHDICVIKICRDPGGRRMAVFAIVAAGDMARGFARRIQTVVAADTISRDVGMIKGRR